MAKTNEGNIPLMKPKVCILRSDGTNCDEELFYAFEKFGSAPEYVHVNQLRARNKRLNAYQILALPGGFSYGDDIASGKVLAIELISFLKNELDNWNAIIHGYNDNGVRLFVDIAGNKRQGHPVIKTY